LAVPGKEAALALAEIRKAVRIPLVADIHFNFRLALAAIKAGVDKIRINPGNIGERDRVRRVLDAARARSIPVRIGVNAGSLSRKLIKAFNGVTAEALVASAEEHIRICEEEDFQDIVISIKASDVRMMIEANRILSAKYDYPLHLGVTEAGTRRWGPVRSAVGIGTLLAEGIGDTLRVSLTGDPVEEVRTGYEILKSLKFRNRGLTIISCPTCGRLETNLAGLVEKVENALDGVSIPITVAMMGCAVNGPGEAKEADIGIACGRHEALLFRKGKVIRKLKEEEIVETLVKEVKQWKG
jgi:(E)-4-hydroxy-3-methylbut-2-enyl-diphosphate synthase